MSSATEDLIAASIEGAEEIRDPLDGLVERAAADPGAPFAPEVLERLAALKRGDRAAFEALRAHLKRTGCRVTALDEAVADESGGARGRGPTQADILIELAAAAELFHTPDGTGLADLNVNGHRETWPIRAKGFRRWLARRFFEATQGAPSSEALQSALNVIEARAHFDASEREVHVRVAGLDERLYLDLADETWRAIEIGVDGWRVIDSPPVRFRRAAGMQPLPVPLPGGSVAALRSFLNVQTDTDFVLVIAWALAVLRNRGPYPVLVLAGEQGSAKSTFSAILRALLDPNTAPLRALPREDRDLFIIDAQIAHGDSFHNDQHPDLKADYVIANPPFNDSDWRGDLLKDDKRWIYGTPPAGNANLAWVQHFIHHLAPAGLAGFVLANGSMSSNQSGEGEIRKAIIEADLVDCMVALPGQLFYSTQIPVCLWFLARDKRNGRFRDRREQVLFIDARKLGTMIDRVHRELTDDDIAEIAGTYHAWRGDKGAPALYADVPGFCMSATLEEIRQHGHVLTPGRYVGTEAIEEDAEPFNEKMERLTATLRAQMEEGRRLDAVIAANLKELGYGA